MKLLKFDRLNFYFEFFEKDSIIPHYRCIHNNTNGQSLNRKDNFPTDLKNKVYAVSCVPPYFDVELDQNFGCGAFRISSRQGFIANLKGYDSVDGYMEDCLKKQKRNIIRKLKRLELCFDINYKTLYGEANIAEYNSLFDALEVMIQKRFSQKNIEHAGLKRWKDYKTTVYNMILNKRASLFGIYDGEKPISISLSYHFQNILVSAISSYDIDYSKFGLGNIQVLKKIEWCFENEYDNFDMMWGDLRYKREWCNNIFTYEDHVLFAKRNLGKILSAFTITKFSQFKKFLEAKNLLPFSFKKLNVFRKKQKPQKNKKREPIYKIMELDNAYSKDGLFKINIDDSEEYALLRQPTYDFQYANSEHSRTINVYEIQEKMYLLEGKTNKIKLEFL
ncbi:GNAT family N-acetyltransferase [Allomuricauda sp. R78024]|uniref:GNAT family N-acetyltransferase n=1 Tax=Allomuricauda sp. R78024 TaxID=3093867 RepID=UPI0037CB09A2